MRTRAYPAAALAALAAVTAAIGCGSGSSPEPSDLAASLPGDPPFVSYLDLAAAKEALELPDDADPADYGAIDDLDDPTPEAQLVQAARNSLPHVTEAFTVTFEPDATTEAIDHTQVTAAASSLSPEAGGRAAILATEQPFDEIAEALEASGFELDGDVYAGESAEPKPQLPYVADLGDGRIVVAAELADAEEALAGKAEPAEAATLLAELDAPQREATEVDLDDTCVTAFALGGEPGGSEVELAFTVDAEAVADRVPSEVELVTGDEPAQLGEPDVDGETVRVTATPPEGVTDPSTLFAAGAILGNELYDCG
jgi:hypothetical protein